MPWNQDIALGWRYNAQTMYARLKWHFHPNPHRLVSNYLVEDLISKWKIGNFEALKFKVDRLQIIVVAKNITVLQLFISRMP